MTKSKYTAAQVHFPSAEQRENVQEAARIVGVSFSEFVREAALAKTAKVLREHARTKGHCPTCGAHKKRAA